MHIVILGAGQVGGTLAQNLTQEDHNITVVDLNEDRLRELQNRMDILTVQGSGAHPDVLIHAGIEQADMLIAVTDSDEINMMGCRIAYSLFKTPTKIARIRSRNYLGYPELFNNDNVPVDVCISPEALVTAHIENLIEYPGASQVLDFAEGKVLVVSIKPLPDGVMIGKSLETLRAHLGAIGAKVIALFRNNTDIPLTPDAVIAKGDEVLFITTPESMHDLLKALGRYTRPTHRVMIAGGGHIGGSLAQALEEHYKIKIIERDSECANELAIRLHKSTVLQGDIADRDLLVNENIEFTDLFCAVTNDDEANIMSCLQAKKLGARHTMALVNRNAYVELIEDSTIDHAISPQLITIGSILTKMRRGNMVKVYRLSNGGEAIELVAHGDESTSRVVGRKLREIVLPTSCAIAAIVRKQEVILAEPELQLQSQDHVIVVVLKKRYLRQIETLFQVKFNFLG